MKKNLLLLLCFILSIYKINAQTNWELLNPKPTANTGNDVIFVSENVGYIITSNEIIETLDAGNSWQKKQNITSGIDINFFNNLGFIVGNYGYVLKSVDNGTSWTQISTGFNNSFNSVNIIDENNIIISSPNNLVKSNNGGVTWQSLIIPNVTVNKTFFVSTLVGHAACDNGKMLKTIDGGQNWYVTQSTNTIPSDFFTVYFINENIGFSTREHDNMYKTTDGGETWTEISGVSFAVYDFHFLDENIGFITGEFGATYKTINGGISWTPIFFQNGYYDNTSMYGIYFEDSNVGYATGARGRIIKTIDGGNTWVQHSPTYNDIRQLKFVDSNTGYAQSGSDFYKTIDNGNTWSLVGSLSLGTSVFSSDFTFVTNYLGYATTGGTYGGNVYKTIDGGVTWSALNVKIDEGITSIFFLDENVGFISGGYNQTKVLKTTDGGNTWIQVFNENFGEIQFLNNQVGYGNRIGNYYNRIYKTTDGGNSWSYVFEINEDINSFHFINEKNGYFVGDNAICYKTNDGGTTWQIVSIPYEYYELVKFYSINVGYIADEDGKLYRTMNGGESWEYLTSQYGMKSIELINDNIFTAGSNGKIYRTTIETVGISNQYTKEQISIYPNPTNDFININIKNNERIKSIEFYNMIGKVVEIKKESNSSDIIRIDISNFCQGIYLIKINFETKKTITSKLIIN